MNIWQSYKQERDCLARFVAFHQRVGQTREVHETTTLLAPLFWPTLYTSVVATDRTPSVRSRVFAHLVGRDVVPTQDMAFTPTRFLHCAIGVRTYGQMGSADPPGKMDEKLKSENMQKRAVFYLCVIF